MFCMLGNTDLKKAFISKDLRPEVKGQFYKQEVTDNISKILATMSIEHIVDPFKRRSIILLLLSNHIKIGQTPKEYVEWIETIGDLFPKIVQKLKEKHDRI